MPRKAAPPTEPTETRRSTRIAEKPVSSAATSSVQPKKAPASKKKRETVAEEEAHEEEEPAAKKVSSIMGSRGEIVNLTDQHQLFSLFIGGVTKSFTLILSKAKPDSKAKPESKVKPTSKVKPDSKAATKGTKPVSKKEEAAKEAEVEAPATAVVESIPEEKEVEVEDKVEAEVVKAPEDKMDVDDPKEEVDELSSEKASPKAEEIIKELQVGDKLPDWSFENEKGEMVEIAKLAGEQGLVLFLVPKADTRKFLLYRLRSHAVDQICYLLLAGCNTQACGFRDSFPDFEKYGYAVYALSNDKSTAQSKWQSKVRLLPSTSLRI